MPKQCSYLPAQRASLHEELTACSDANKRYALISYLNSRAGAHTRNTSTTSSSYGKNNTSRRPVGTKHSGGGGSGREEEEWVSVVSLSKTVNNLRRLQDNQQAGCDGADDADGGALAAGNAAMSCRVLSVRIR